MRDIVQKVLEAEAEARLLVEAAEREAALIVSDAAKQADALTARVTAESRIEAERLIADAALAAEQDRQACLSRAAAEIEAQVKLTEPSRQQAIEAVVLSVCGLK